LLPNMYVLMCLQRTLHTEWLITYFTEKWLLPTMYVHMPVQNTLQNEWLFT
jgi:hypothetical protein